MTDEEILLRRLHGQFLLAPGGVREVAALTDIASRLEALALA